MMVTELCACGVRFAIGLMRCPRCQAVSARFAGVVKEDAVPRITVAGGPSNAAALPGEVGHMPPGDAEPFATGGLVQGPGVHVVEDGPAPFTLPPGWTPAEAPAAPDYGSMTQAALRELAKERGLPVGGTKADLAARLAHADDATLPTEAQAVLAGEGAAT